VVRESGRGGPATPDVAKDKLLAPAQRDEHLARARIVIDSMDPARDAFVGPGGSDAFSFLAVVDCRYDPDQTSAGRSPKFFCRDAQGDKLKVKYGCSNGEVFGEVAASRLLWLLGFAADRMYPVIVRCRDCPPIGGVPLDDGSLRLDCAVIERKSGDALEATADQGWAWNELDAVRASAGGGTRAHIDALRLMAALLQHNDSKPENQRLECSAGDWVRTADGRACRAPRLLIQDLGATFGGAGNRVRWDSKVDLEHWREQRIWRDGATCTANLAGSTLDGTLSDPQIGEAGRALLAERLMRLTPKQVRDLFRAARVTLRDRGTTIEDWERAFWYKAWQIVHHRCPGGT
jgi:hypothetical protein